MNKLMSMVLAVFVVTAQLNSASASDSFAAQPTSCINSSFSATGNSNWQNISLKLTNNCGQSVDFQNTKITFVDASSLDTSFWGDFSSLSYPDNVLQITSQMQTDGTFLATLNLHFPTTTGSNSILPKGGSIVLYYGAPTADYVANSVQVYLGAPPNTGSIAVSVPALPSELRGYTNNPNVTATKIDSGASVNANAPWNAVTPIAPLENGSSYTLSTPNIIFNGTNCAPSFVPASVVAAETPPTVNLTYVCSPVAQEAATINVSGAPGSLTQVSVTLTPNDGSAALTQIVNLTNGSGSASVSLTAGTIYTLSTSAIPGYSVHFSPQPLQAAAGVVETITFSPSSSKVPGWPNYLAMGAVTDDSPATQTSLQSRPIDAIFKYGGLGGNGDPGQIVYPIFDLETAQQAQALSASYQQQQLPNKVIPTMVIYTAQMSGGTSFTDFEYTNMVMHYINLIMEAQKLQSFQSAQFNYPGAIILNPDLFGMLQQENLLNDANTAISQVQLQKALQTAVCFATSTIDTNYGTGLNYEALFQAIRSKTTDNWSAMSTWDTYKMQYFNHCTANPTVPASITIPGFTNDFPGWVQSTNWIIRQFAPNVTFGWQVNLWGVGSSNWVHQNYDAATLKANVSDPTVALIDATTAYQGNYKPDFIVFDKYEMDAIPGAVGSGYLFNARDWFNVLNYINNVSGSLGNIPVMLWQIPGGHLQQNNDVDMRTSHASTEPDFFFGDSYNPLSNLKSYILGTSLSSSIYGTSNIMDYLMMDAHGGNLYVWQTNNLQHAASSNVFAILWGGGNTTSVGSFPSDDGGWLANKINNYYKNPVSLPLR
ncbi:chitinase [Legionella cherrii]|uniref:Chitinase n=1 Tax=Legionella cherrii TaxID=28084 RepID=A0A0W0SB51_9GAMM|nr:hypothetical protein [Legionella cherrii]KTC80560.1 chitinase [Legionella cherrii]